MRALVTRCHRISLSFARLAVAALVVVTFVVVFTPFSPSMPATGLDPSWKFAMNQAVAQGLAIGNQIIFTFGPFGSIYTREYHPATDHLMFFGGALLGLGYAAALLYGTSLRRLPAILALLFALASGLAAGDALLLSYPLLITLAVIRFNAEWHQQPGIKGNLSVVGLALLMILPLGLLPLVKGSLLLVCAAGMVSLCIFLLYYRRFASALLVVAGTIGFSIVFWQLSGQSAGAFPAYFVSMLPIISGYTDAMELLATPDSGKGPIVFLAAAATMLWALAQVRGLEVAPRILLLFSLAVFLFLSFKAGFVRHDGHAMTAARALVIAAWWLVWLSPDRRVAFAVLVSIPAWALIDQHNADTSTRKAIERAQAIYANAGKGLRERVQNRGEMTARFDSALNKIRQACPVPELSGTTDVYSYGQSCLIASGNHWNPRPIFQSYSVYTPLLAQINAQHIRGEAGPDNILFRVEPIDRRLPALEDGLSWPALIDNYRVVGWQADAALLSRRAALRQESNLQVIDQRWQRLGEATVIPSGEAPIFAQIDLAPTSLGKAVAFAYKLPQLTMTLRLTDGEERRYRVIANMMKAGFFISPLVEDNTDFVLLATGYPAAAGRKQVAAISITPSYGGGWLWSTQFEVTLKRFERVAIDPLPAEMLSSVK